jgi:prophage antirepressor-like protein
MKTNEVQLFNFNGNEVTVIAGEDGSPLFVAKRVCDILGLANSRRAMHGLDDDEKLMLRMVTSGQARKVTVINESGLYSLIIKSRKPEARAFRKWVTSEVLPQIRKTGVYAGVAEETTEPQPEQNVNMLYISDRVQMRFLQSPEYGVLVGTSEMARALGVSASGIRVMKHLHYKELEAGVHYVDNYQGNETCWLREGLIWYAYHIHRGRAVDLRNWAERELTSGRDTKENRQLMSENRLINIMMDVCRIEDSQLRISIAEKLVAGSSAK